MPKSLLKLVFLLICFISISAQEKSSSISIENNKNIQIKKDNSGIKFNDSSEKFEVYHKKQYQLSIAKNIVIILLVAALIGLYLFYASKQKKRFSKFKNIIRNQQKLNYNLLNENSIFSNISVVELEGDDEEVNKKRNESLMTSETEAKLLELLDDFEKGTLYNNKNMSLPFLAGELNTNTKYLSYIINQHKSTDFKSYINRLRIRYIVGKLTNDEKYRQYKISILAEECGFSSHSKFASIFKAVTDFSPSAFIKHVEEENKVVEAVHFPENN